jgi:hypothetical protein
MYHLRLENASFFYFLTGKKVGAADRRKNSLQYVRLIDPRIVVNAHKKLYYSQPVAGEGRASTVAVSRKRSGARHGRLDFP